MDRLPFSARYCGCSHCPSDRVRPSHRMRMLAVVHRAAAARLTPSITATITTTAHATAAASLLLCRRRMSSATAAAVGLHEPFQVQQQQGTARAGYLYSQINTRTHTRDSVRRTVTRARRRTAPLAGRSAHPPPACASPPHSLRYLLGLVCSTRRSLVRCAAHSQCVLLYEESQHGSSDTGPAAATGGRARPPRQHA